MTSYLVKLSYKRRQEELGLSTTLTRKLREQLVYLYKFNWQINTRVKEESFKLKENDNPRRNLYKFHINKLNTER